MWCEGMTAQRKLHSGAAVPRSAEVNSANEVGSDGCARYSSMRPGFCPVKMGGTTSRFVPDVPLRNVRAFLLKGRDRHENARRFHCLCKVWWI